MRFIIVAILMFLAVWAIWESFDSSRAKYDHHCEGNKVERTEPMRSGGTLVICKNEVIRYVPKGKR